MENTIRIIETVEKTHKNLGLPVVFAKLIDAAYLGLFISGHRGTGKGAILNSIKKLRHRDVIEITRITPAGLAKEAAEWSGRRLTIINPDFSSFYTEYLKDAGINLMAHLISEHSVPKSWTARYSYEITDCHISFLTSTQPRMIRKINSLPQWESMYCDRFIRFHMLYPYGKPQYRRFYPEVPTLELELGEPETDVVIPKSIREMPEYARLRTILWRQTSEGRAGIYLDRLLRAHAWLNNRDTVAPKDVHFLLLFAPYLVIDFLLADRETVSSPLRFNPDAYLVFFYLVEHEEATRKQLKHYFMLVKEKGKYTALSRALDPLRAKNLIEGVYGTPKYRINRKWKQTYLQPLLDFAKEHGLIR